MKFYIDKTKVTEGDIVEVTWRCPKSESVKISINNGFKSVTSEVEKEGNKKFKLNRSNGFTTITLDAVENGKPINRELKIKVLPPKLDDYTRIDNKPIKEKLETIKTRMKYFWKSLPSQKQQAYIILSLIVIIMIVSAFYPAAISFGLIVIALYLLFVLAR